MMWSPRSCDLKPQNNFLRSYVKLLVEADKFKRIDALKENKRRIIADIRPMIVAKTGRKASLSGGHLTEIIF